MLDLPVELLMTILSEGDVLSLVALTQCCSLLRNLREEIHIWAAPLKRGMRLNSLLSAETASVPRVDRGHALDEAFENLITATRHAPVMALVDVLVVADRSFILSHLEIGCLSSKVWQHIVDQRLLASMGGLKFARTITERRGKSWRSLFYSKLLEFERYNSRAFGQHNLDYVVIHRKSGFSRNRTSTREYNPVDIFQELKYGAFPLHV